MDEAKVVNAAAAMVWAAVHEMKVMGQPRREQAAARASERAVTAFFKAAFGRAPTAEEMDRFTG